MVENKPNVLFLKEMLSLPATLDHGIEVAAIAVLQHDEETLVEQIAKPTFALHDVLVSELLQEFDFIHDVFATSQLGDFSLFEHVELVVVLEAGSIHRTGAGAIQLLYVHKVGQGG